MRQTPYRPGHEISQTYNSGVLTVYAAADGAEPGFAPRPVLTVRARLRYEERRLGVQRYYAAMQAQARVDRVVRVPRGPAVSPQDVVETEDGQQYRVDLVQAVQDVWPPSLDLTLSRVDQGLPLPQALPEGVLEDAGQAQAGG